MTTKWNSNYHETIPFSDTCKQFNLATSAEQTYTVPGAATVQYQALFSFNAEANLFVTLNGTAAAPTAGANTSVAYNEFRPHKRYVKGGDVIHLISPDTTTYVGLSLRQLQG